MIAGSILSLGQFQRRGAEAGALLPSPAAVSGALASLPASMSGVSFLLLSSSLLGLPPWPRLQGPGTLD